MRKIMRGLAACALVPWAQVPLQAQAVPRRVALVVAVDTVVGRMEGSGVRTVLVFLDSRRANPFPGASRSGTRCLPGAAPAARAGAG